MSIKPQAGMTLVELVIAIIVISVGLAGVLTAFSTVVKNSADPLIQKQMLSIAEEMMEEITLKPFAPSGTASANSPQQCTSGTNVAPRLAFDDVSDYQNYQTTGICNIDGDAIAALSSYSIAVAVDAAASLGTVAGGNVKKITVKKITVTVSHGSESMQLVGWRTAYAS